MKKFVLAITLLFVMHTATLRWTPSVSSTVDHYRVYRSLTPGGPYVYMSAVPASVTTYVNGNAQYPLIEGQQYCYVVTALAGTLESAKSNEACGVVPITPVAPFAPIDLTVVTQ